MLADRGIAGDSGDDGIVQPRTASRSCLSGLLETTNDDLRPAAEVGSGGQPRCVDWPRALAICAGIGGQSELGARSLVWLGALPDQ